MSKMIVDETEWCQHEHQLKHYGILIKAINWRNACCELLHEKCHNHADEQSKSYKHAHTLSWKAEEFFNLLTGNISTKIVVGFPDKGKRVEKQFRAVVKEVLG